LIFPYTDALPIPADQPAMQPVQPSRSEFITINQHHYHLRHWGEPSAPLLVMLHGWMDSSATFQFLVDALPGNWHVVAPDWRGFGDSAWNTGSYYFPITWPIWMPCCTIFRQTSRCNCWGTAWAR
jgi:pimeloyl-ACP methyl ester carboxylesterase